MSKLEWNVFVDNFNKQEIVTCNILDSKIFKNEVLDKKPKTREELKELIEKWAKYHYWCRAEWEILIGGLFYGDDKFQKVDVYQQIMINIDRLVDYVWKVISNE